MTPYQWQTAGQYLDFRQQRIFYRRSGAEKPALLLLHGFPTSSWDWCRVWPELSGHFSLIAADMLGFGFSAKPRPYDYSISLQADLQEHLLDSLGVGEADILAHNYGDTVAQELMARRLNGQLGFDIRSVVFLNGGLFPGVHRPRPIQKLLMSPMGRYLTPFLGKGDLAGTFRRIFGPHTQPTEEEIDQFWSLIERENGKKVIPLLIHYMRERVQQRDRWVGALQKSLLPMLLINGAADPISGKHLAAHYRKVVPNDRVVELEKVGHYPQLEAPARVVEECLAFWKAVKEENRFA